jgi:Helix-turn-helix domain
MNVVNLKTKLNQQIQPANEQLRKEFATKKLAWIDRLLLDLSVSDLQFRVAVLISNKYLNYTKGYAWPKQDVMAADLGLKRRAVQNALDALVGAGHLGREVARGHGRNNRYWPFFDTENGDIRCAPACTSSDDDDPQMCTATTDDVHGDDKSDVHGHTHNNP